MKTAKLTTAETLTRFASELFQNGMIFVDLRDGVYWLCCRKPEGGFRSMRSVGVTGFPIKYVKDEIRKVAAEY